MSFIGSMFDPSKGAGFQAGNTNILQSATVDQANQAYNQSQQGIAQQQAFLQALQGQNGIGNQSSVFNQLQGVANGTGPNPAQAQLAQATGANNANQAALMAGQRGAGANTGLIARQAAQQGAANQQNAAGQGATMQANQSLGALNQLGGIAGQQVQNQQGALTNLNQAAQGEQGQVLGAIQGQNNANVGMQSNQNSANASIASGNAKASSGLLGGLLNGGAASSMLAHGGQVQHLAYGTPKVQMPPIQYQGYNNPTANQQMAALGSPSQPQSTAGKYLSGLNVNNSVHSLLGQGIDAVGNAIGSLFKSAPQQVDMQGGASAQPVKDLASSGIMTAAFGFPDKNQIGDRLPASEPVNLKPAFDYPGTRASDIKRNITDSPRDNSMKAARGGKVPAMVSPGEKYLNPAEAQAVAHGAITPDKVGEIIPGKAKVKGDSLKNDTVPKNLEEGGCVIPRSEMKDMSSAIRFVHAHMRMAKGGKVKAKK